MVNQELCQQGCAAAEDGDGNIPTDGLAAVADLRREKICEITEHRRC